jgi:hypothetical protein
MLKISPLVLPFSSEFDPKKPIDTAEGQTPGKIDNLKLMESMEGGDFSGDDDDDDDDEENDQDYECGNGDASGKSASAQKRNAMKNALGASAGSSQIPLPRILYATAPVLEQALLPLLPEAWAQEMRLVRAQNEANGRPTLTTYKLSTLDVLVIQNKVSAVKTLLSMAHKVKNGDAATTCAQDMVCGYTLATALDRVEIVKIMIEICGGPFEWEKYFPEQVNPFVLSFTFTFDSRPFLTF